MKTQQEQLKRAKRAYLVPLNTTWTRWAVYLADNKCAEGLDVLWPGDSHLGQKTKELLPGQIYSKARQYPAFHFHLTGCGYSKPNEIARTLITINSLLQVFSGLQTGGRLSQEA